MSNEKSGVKIFSASTLKLLACLFMLSDHVGVVLFPSAVWLRVIGRLAYPIFAFFIAQGCRYTKNKLRRFLNIFVLGVLCELCFVTFSHEYYGNILLTFSISVLLIYLFDAVKKSFYKNKVYFALLSVAFVLSLVLVYLYCRYIGVDYGFFGVIAPLSLTLLDSTGKAKNRIFSIDKSYVSLCLFSVVLLLLALSHSTPSYQMWSLCAVVLLLFYNGERGKYSLKYFFYLFYPLHLVVLQLIAILVNMKA